MTPAVAAEHLSVAGRAHPSSEAEVGRLFAAAEPDFNRYEVLKDLVDECIDLSLN